MILANMLSVEPTSILGVDWTASMIFMVLVGGLNTFEGPIIGAIVLFVIQNEFGNDGGWCLVGLGGAAMFFALLLPRGVRGGAARAFRVAAFAGRLPHALRRERRIAVRRRATTEADGALLPPRERGERA
jgi:hypothetical protein